VRVTLLEARDVAAGTSGACDGNIMVQSKKPGLVLDLAKASAALYPGLLDELGEDIEYERRGSLMVFEHESDLEVLRPIIAGQRAAGLDVQLLTPTDAAEIQPGLADHVIHATYLASDASVDQLGVCFALARVLRAQGVTIELGTVVNGLIADGDAVAGVRTDRGNVLTRTVVLALGVWTPEIAASVGVKLEIVPRKGYILVTEKWPPMVRTALLSPSYVRHKHEANAATALSGTDSVSFSLHQSRIGTCFIGSSREFLGFDDSTSPEIVRAMARAAVRMFPAVGNVRLARSFAGLRPFTPDGKPIIGESSSCRGLYIAAGHEGDGIALGPVTGQIVADLVVDHASPWDLSSVSPDRFTVSHAAAG
jgi:sarcosine oxidase subunit beta